MRTEATDLNMKQKILALRAGPRGINETGDDKKKKKQVEDLVDQR